MYLPYLRNRTNELFAVIEVAPKIVQHRLVVPIFHVIDTGSNFFKRAKRIAKEGQRFAIILNSASVKSNPGFIAEFQKLRTDFPKLVIPAFEFDKNTTAIDFSVFHASYGQLLCLIVRRSDPPSINVVGAISTLGVAPIVVYLESEIGKLSICSHSSGNILLCQAFQKQTTNGAYPSRSNFLNYVDSYKASHWAGIGDFTIVADEYKPGGGPASHVALHITEPAQSNLVCNHFVSHSTASTAHIRFKYADALAQLRSHALNNPTVFSTLGASRFLALHTFPQLGVTKRWSIEHHLELMSTRMAHRGDVPFF
ncbi:sce7725 family protein [Xanthomonas sacchari]|uniref:sce7725 family protein n=1 Tax=Xanthomonas sacchari TaxID=56458 RepID=UPI00225487DD|nr:sce7725 family protein [Xanthomonas sacchari]MCW0447482.1 hypothetical protein [Xanthomonas sacchari]